MAGGAARRTGGEGTRAALKASRRAASSSTAFSLLSDVDLLIDAAFPVPVRKTVRADEREVGLHRTPNKRRKLDKGETNASASLQHGRPYEFSERKGLLADQGEESDAVLEASELLEEDGEVRNSGERGKARCRDARVARMSPCGFSEDEEENSELCRSWGVGDDVEFEAHGACASSLCAVGPSVQPCCLSGRKKRKRLKNSHLHFQEDLLSKEEDSEAATGQEAARSELHFFARHPAAWELCCRALYRARAALCTLEALRGVRGGEGNTRSRELLRSLLQRQLRLFSSCWGEPEAEEDTDEKCMQDGQSSGEEASTVVIRTSQADDKAHLRNDVPPQEVSRNGSLPEAQDEKVDREGESGDKYADTRRCTNSTGDESTTPSSEQVQVFMDEEDLLEFRLFSRALFAARVLRLLCDVGLPFLQLPTPCNASLLSAPSLRLPVPPSFLSGTSVARPSLDPLSHSPGFAFSSPSAQQSAPSNGGTGSTGGPQRTVQPLSASPYYFQSPSRARSRPPSPSLCPGVSPSHLRESLREEGAVGEEETEEATLNALLNSLPFDYRLTTEEGWVSSAEGLGDRVVGNSAIRISPFVTREQSPLPLASPQQLSREMLPLVHLCCVYSDIPPSSAPSREGRRRHDLCPRCRRPSAVVPQFVCRFPSDEVDSCLPHCCSVPGLCCMCPVLFRKVLSPQERADCPSCGAYAPEMSAAGSVCPCSQSAFLLRSSCQHSEQAAWLRGWEEVWRELSAAVAALLAHAMAQQQQEGAAAVPALQNQTPLQRVVRLAQTFCERGQRGRALQFCGVATRAKEKGDVVSPRRGAGFGRCGGSDRLHGRKKAQEDVEAKGDDDLAETVGARRAKGALGSWDSSEREQQNSSALMQGGEGSERVGENVVVSVQHGRFCIEVIRNLVSIAQLPSAGGGRHVSGPEQRLLFRTAFLRESPLVCLLLQQTLSQAARCVLDGGARHAVAVSGRQEDSASKAELPPTANKCQCSRLHAALALTPACIDSPGLVGILQVIRGVLAFWQRGLDQEQPGSKEISRTLVEIRLCDGFFRNGGISPGITQCPTTPGGRSLEVKQEAGGGSHRSTTACPPQVKSSLGLSERGNRETESQEKAEEFPEYALQLRCRTREDKEAGLLEACKEARKDFTLFLLGTFSIDGGLWVRKLVETLLGFLEAESCAKVPLKDLQCFFPSKKKADSSSMGDPSSVFSSLAPQVHFLGSEVLCRLFSLASSLYFVLSSFYEGAWPPSRSQPSATSSAHWSPVSRHRLRPPPFTSADSSASVAFAADVLRLTAGECTTRAESAAQQAVSELPRLLCWIESSCLASLSRASAALLPLVMANWLDEEPGEDCRTIQPRNAGGKRAESEVNQLGGAHGTAASLLLNKAVHATLVWQRSLCYHVLPAGALSAILCKQQARGPWRTASASDAGGFSLGRACLSADSAHQSGSSTQDSGKRTVRVSDQTQNEPRTADGFVPADVGELCERVTADKAPEPQGTSLFHNTPASWLPLSRCLALPLVFGEAQGRGRVFFCATEGAFGEPWVTSDQQSRPSGHSGFKRESPADYGRYSAKEEEARACEKGEARDFAMFLRSALVLPLRLLGYGAEQRVSEVLVRAAVECLCIFFAPFVRLRVLSEGHGAKASGGEETPAPLRTSHCSERTEGKVMPPVLDAGKDKGRGTFSGELRGVRSLRRCSLSASGEAGDVPEERCVLSDASRPGGVCPLADLAWDSVREALKCDSLLPALVSLVVSRALVRVPGDATLPTASELQWLTVEGSTRGTLTWCGRGGVVSLNAQRLVSELQETEGQSRAKKMSPRRAAREQAGHVHSRGNEESVVEGGLESGQGEVPRYRRWTFAFGERGREGGWGEQLQTRRQCGRLLQQLAVLDPESGSQFREPMLIQVGGRTPPTAESRRCRMPQAARRDTAGLRKGSEGAGSQTQSGHSSSSDRGATTEGEKQETRLQGEEEHVREHLAFQALETSIWAHLQLSRGCGRECESVAGLEVVCLSLLGAYLQGVRGYPGRGGRLQPMQVPPFSSDPGLLRCETGIGRPTTLLCGLSSAVKGEEGRTQFSYLLSAVAGKHRSCWRRLLLLVSAATFVRVETARRLLTVGSNDIFGAFPASEQTLRGHTLSDFRHSIELALCFLYLLLDVSASGVPAFARRTGNVSGAHSSSCEEVGLNALEFQSRTVFSSGVCAFAWSELVSSLVVQLGLVNRLISTSSFEQVASAWTGVESLGSPPPGVASSAVGEGGHEKPVTPANGNGSRAEAQSVLQELRGLLSETLAMLIGKLPSGGVPRTDVPERVDVNGEPPSEQERRAEEEGDLEGHRRRSREEHHRSSEEELNGCPARELTRKSGKDSQRGRRYSVCDCEHSSLVRGGGDGPPVESGNGRGSASCSDTRKTGEPSLQAHLRGQEENGACDAGRPSSEAFGVGCPARRGIHSKGRGALGWRQGYGGTWESQGEAGERGQDKERKNEGEPNGRGGENYVTSAETRDKKTASSATLTLLDVDRTPVAVEEGLLHLISLASQPQSAWSGAKERAAVVHVVVDLLSHLLCHVKQGTLHGQTCCCCACRNLRDQKETPASPGLSSSVKAVDRAPEAVQRQSTCGSEEEEVADPRDSFLDAAAAGTLGAEPTHACCSTGHSQAPGREPHRGNPQLSCISNAEGEEQVLFPSALAACAAADSASGLRRQGREPSSVSEAEEAKQEGMDVGASVIVRGQYENQAREVHCSVTGGCPDCVTVLSSAFRRSRRCVVALMTALEMCLSSPLLLFVFVNELRGFQALSNFLQLMVLEGGLRALHQAVRQASDERRLVRSLPVFDKKGAGEFSSGALSWQAGPLVRDKDWTVFSNDDPAAGRISSVVCELREALGATLRCILSLVQVSRKTPLSSDLLAPRRLACKSSTGCRNLCYDEILGTPEGSIVFPGAKGVLQDALRYLGGMTTDCSLEARRRTDARGSLASWSDIALFVPAAEEPKETSTFCCCCGRAIDNEGTETSVVRFFTGKSEDRQSGTFIRRQEAGRGRQGTEDGGSRTMSGVATPQRNAKKQVDGLRGSSVVDSSTLVWCIGESCARAAAALFRQPTSTPLSRLLREELLFRLGLNYETQRQVLSNSLQPLRAVPPAFSGAFTAVEQPAISGRQVEQGSPQLLGSSACSPCGSSVLFSGSPPGADRGGLSSGVVLGGSPQIQQALLVGLQHHQALQTMEEQMLRVLETQQMEDGIAEENEGTDGGPAALVEVLLHTICSILFETRTGATGVASLHSVSLLADPRPQFWGCPAQRYADRVGCTPVWPQEAVGGKSCSLRRETLQAGKWRGEEVCGLCDADEDDHEYLLLLLLHDILLPPASRVFKIVKGEAKGTAQVQAAEKDASLSTFAKRAGATTASPASPRAGPSQSTAAEDGDSNTRSQRAQLVSGSGSNGRTLLGSPETEEQVPNSDSLLYNALTIPPPLQLHRWPFILSFHVLAASCFPLHSNIFLRNTVFGRCCPCCPLVESTLTRCRSASRTSREQELKGGALGNDSDEAISPAQTLRRVTRWCCCCYCFPQPHSPCPKASAAGTPLSFVLPALMAASMAISHPGSSGCHGVPTTLRGAPSAERDRISSQAAKRHSLDRAAAGSDCLSSTCCESRPCAPGTVAVFASALVAAAFKPHLFSLLDTNASYSTNTWPDASSALFSPGGCSPVYSGNYKGGSADVSGPMGRGSAASAAPAAGAAADSSGIQQHAHLPVLLQSPPVFLLHPLQEVLLHGFPRRFGSLIAGIQAPQPHTVPPLARVAAATAKALQFTAAQQPGVDSPCRRASELRSPDVVLQHDFEHSVMFRLVRSLKQRMFAVDFLRVAALLQQQQLLHRHRQLDVLASVAKTGIGAVVAPSNADSADVSPTAETAAAIGAAAATGDVLLLLRLVAPARPAGSAGPGSSPSAKETAGGKGLGGGRHGGSGAGGHSGDSYRRGGVVGGKFKGKRRD